MEEGSPDRRALFFSTGLPGGTMGCRVARLRRDASGPSGCGIMTDQPFAVALVSGGLDSMVSAALAREAGYRLLALSVDLSLIHI